MVASSGSPQPSRHPRWFLALTVPALLAAVVGCGSSSSEPEALTPPRESIDVGTMCSAFSSYPDKWATIATSSVPPTEGSGDVGRAASFRLAADMTEDRCPQHISIANKLRERARYLDPGNPDN